jgi:prepilin-type N-terminal cleavage/methylation domain-containing protein/prepilin-type processing-associated H-X9-DG protein
VELTVVLTRRNFLSVPEVTKSRLSERTIMRLIDHAGNDHWPELGFTLTELSVVTGVIGVLASLLTTGLSKAKGTSQSMSCLNNLRQLQLAWHMYADDHNDTLPANQWFTVEWGDGCPQGIPAVSGSWVVGTVENDRNGWGIKNGTLFPYVHDIRVYHCPTDKSVQDIGRRPRYRSYSASFYMNGNANKFDPQVKKKTFEIEAPQDVFVFLDEHENSIDDSVFFFHSPGDTGERSEAKTTKDAYQGAHWMSMPSGRHNQGGSFTFADGHAEHWTWRWPKKLSSPDADRDLANDLDYHDYRRLQAALPPFPSELQLTSVP